ncbi:MAG: radical SAM family heme chaperone HemW [Ignavibacteria bacterium]
MSGIYLHIPFCGKRCNYCDFYLITNLNVIDKYLINLKKEISLYSDKYRKETFNTVFFGGGTPSLLSPGQLENLLDHLHKNFSISSNAEITIEANPEDFFDKKLSDYRSAGINRISFGVQSFLDQELKFLTRRHTASDAERITADASKVFDNINLDIIYSLPHQTISEIDHSLSKAIELNVKHISAYTLTYEKRTVLYKSYQRKLTDKNSQSEEGALYNFVSEKLKSNNYKHYEVSNFSQENYECRHNLTYWNYDNYAGFGPSSHSMMSGERRNNYSDILKYNSLLEKNILPVEQNYTLTFEQSKLEYLMLALRSTGLNFENYRNIFKEDPEKVFFNPMNELVQNNFADRSEKIFRLNDRGYALADEIVARYF